MLVDVALVYVLRVYFSQFGLTKRRRLSSLNNKRLFLNFLEVGKSKIKVPTYSVPGVGTLPPLQMAAF